MWHPQLANEHDKQIGEQAPQQDIMQQMRGCRIGPDPHIDDGQSGRASE